VIVIAIVIKEGHTRDAATMEVKADAVEYGPTECEKEYAAAIGKAIGRTGRRLAKESGGVTLDLKQVGHG
jgi:hypothetical protein